MSPLMTLGQETRHWAVSTAAIIEQLYHSESTMNKTWMATKVWFSHLMVMMFSRVLLLSVDVLIQRHDMDVTQTQI